MIDYPDRRDEFSFSMLILSNIITVIFLVIILILYPSIKNVLDIDFPLVLLMCILFLVQPAYNFWVARQRYELKYKTTVIWTVICAFASPTVAIICISLAENRLYARLFGAEVTLILIYALFYVYLAWKSKCKVNTSYWKTALLFNIPLIPHYLSTFLLGNSNKLLISNIVGPEATAYYSVANAVATVVTIVWGAANSSLIPFTYENCKKKNYKAISDTTMPILTLFGAVCIIAVLLAPEVVAIMATADYMEAVYVIPPIVAGVFFQVQYYLYANVVYYHKKPKYIMYASVTATILNFILGYFMISKFGYLAAGYTTLVCYFLQAFFDYFAMRKVVKEPIYNMKYVGILSLTVVSLALISRFIYDYIVIRYCLILVGIGFCFLFRNYFINMLKKLRSKE